ncbi:CYTH and CHAD domain-containing protein [Streptomyces rectiverticillatus]|uniref:CYTH and CHAD domain-containing protein n=1 Tax=Streptomyces rectiverticillatus TaxID=173860 RepID=UPI0015C35A89|nr:CYTH and CHAD domain-containing protein [Streptomyces rectiverticillatus]QLE72047.1 CYTH and CHAD domain-containing protein [Streptomyces rectiverticillatus]
MADTLREIERKYEAGGPAAAASLPDLSRVAGVATVTDEGTHKLDAVYYDTADRRLAAAGITLRRRTGGSDEGWHLKLPVAPGVRDEIRAPLSPDVPRALTDLVRARIRRAGLVPLVRIRSRREVSRLLDPQGTLLAEASADKVRADRLGDGGRSARWTEFEVELGSGTDPAFLDTVEECLLEEGLRPSDAPSKLARALVETGEGKKAGKTAGKTEAKKPKKPKKKGDRGPVTAGDHVLAYVRRQADALLAYDTAVRRDTEDSVHQMRIATRRLRSAFRTYRDVLDRKVTDPLGAELKWLAEELGADRDREVVAERLKGALGALPDTLVLGPVRARLRIYATGRAQGTGERLAALLDSDRYLTLLDALDALLADPPLRKGAALPAPEVLAGAVLHDYERLAGRVGHALTTAPGPQRDTALHEARKAAKRARYAAEAAVPALGKPAKRFRSRMKDVQTLLGDHQDSVMARTVLRTLAAEAHAAGESTFTLGLLYGREERRAAWNELELPMVWRKASRKRYRADLQS